jgi:AraC-like DNA-binding protein
MVGNDEAGMATLEDSFSVPVHTGASMPAVAVRISDLSSTKPSPPTLEDVIALWDLPSLMGVGEPNIMEAAVREVLILGDLSGDGISRRLSMGPRKLQRSLNSEGTSFREVRDQFMAARARALLSNSETSIDEIARSLGYLEPNSFCRAFRFVATDLSSCSAGEALGLRVRLAEASEVSLLIFAFGSKAV